MSTLYQLAPTCPGSHTGERKLAVPPVDGNQLSLRQGCGPECFKSLLSSSPKSGCRVMAPGGPSAPCSDESEPAVTWWVSRTPRWFRDLSSASHCWGHRMVKSLPSRSLQPSQEGRRPQYTTRTQTTNGHTEEVWAGERDVRWEENPPQGFKFKHRRQGMDRAKFQPRSGGCVEGVHELSVSKGLEQWFLTLEGAAERISWVLWSPVPEECTPSTR